MPVVRVKLTDEGRRRAEAIERLWDDVEAECLDGLDAKERKRLRKSLRRMAKNLAAVTGADTDGFEDDLDDLAATRPSRPCQRNDETCRREGGDGLDDAEVQTKEQQRRKAAQKERGRLQRGDVGPGQRERAEMKGRHRAEQHLEPESHRERSDDADHGRRDGRERARKPRLGDDPLQMGGAGEDPDEGRCERDPDRHERPMPSRERRERIGSPGGGQVPDELVDENRRLGRRLGEAEPSTISAVVTQPFAPTAASAR